MRQDPVVRLIPESGCVEYTEADLNIRFACSMNGVEWIVVKPGWHCREGRRLLDATESEFEKVAPRIEAFLESLWWLSFLPNSGAVHFCLPEKAEARAVLMDLKRRALEERAASKKALTDLKRRGR